MKKFIFQIVTVFTIVLIPLCFVEHKIDRLAQNSYTPPYSSFNYIYNDTINADIVVFGNSRAQCHYYGDLMDTLLGLNSYNFGLSGYSFDYQYNLQILPYIEKNKKPKLLILEVGPQAFFRAWNEHFRKEFLPFINTSYFQFYVDICKEISWHEKLLPIKYYGFGLERLRALTRSTEGNSKYDDYKDCFTPHDIGKYNINFPDTLYDLERDKIIIGYFRDFVTKCEKENIPLLLVCSPMHKKDFYDKCKMNDFWNLIDSLAPNIPKLDYSLMFDSDTTYFAESTHMNLLGAKLFTTQFSHDIDSIGFLK